MLCLYLLGLNSLHFTFKPYLSSETYSRKYGQLPNIVINACKILQKKRICWKCVAREFGVIYLRFDPLRRNSYGSTSIVTLSWLGDADVTHPLWVRELSGSIPRSGKGFYVWFFVLLLYFTSLAKNTLSQNFAISLALFT